jgi:hypothetical protein
MQLSFYQGPFSFSPECHYYVYNIIIFIYIVLFIFNIILYYYNRSLDPSIPGIQETLNKYLLDM